ncbi:Hypothetical predicted protein, partial [Argonauta hians]
MLYTFGFNAGLCTILIVTLNFSAVQAIIQCSRCDSRRDTFYRECEQSPPTPTPCPKNSNSRYCSIVRETDSYGNQLRFERDCISIDEGEKCVETNISANRKKTHCIRTCDFDGCNGQGLKLPGGSEQLSTPFVLLVLVTIILILING